MVDQAGFEPGTDGVGTWRNYLMVSAGGQKQNIIEIYKIIQLLGGSGSRRKP